MDSTFNRRFAAAATGGATGRSFTFENSCTLDYLYVTLVTTATVGNRQVELRVRDKDANVLFAVAMGAVVAASLTRNFAGFESSPRETAFIGTQLLFPWPDDLEVPNSGSLQILDTANVDAADTLALSIGQRDDG